VRIARHSVPLPWIELKRRDRAEALEANKTLGDESGIAIVLVSLAELELGEGHPEEALRASSEAHGILVSGKNALHIAIDHVICTVYRIAPSDLSGARDWHARHYAFPAGPRGTDRHCAAASRRTRGSWQRCTTRRAAAGLRGRAIC
jgi:hypothetical protein